MDKYLEMPEATEQETIEYRNELIKKGIISTNPISVREKLIKNGTIKPLEKLSGGFVTYSPLPKSLNIKSINTEEGEYRVKPIMSDEDYKRRNMVYLRSLQ